MQSTIMAMELKERIQALVLIVPYFQAKEEMRRTIQRIAPIAGFISWFAPALAMATFDFKDQAFYAVHFNSDPKTFASITASTVASNYY